ncbi:MAG: hypothetical protein HQL51_08580 [Magnetococcales bacterium]|nr:hypothetical protein [Magnetococcales bacterium]
MNSSPPLNCWDYFQCQREIGNPHRADSVCSVSLTAAHNGKNGGVNAGRYCWRVEGSFCETKLRAAAPEDPRGSFHFKEEHCAKCSFHKQVMEEMGEEYIP